MLEILFALILAPETGSEPRFEPRLPAVQTYRSILDSLESGERGATVEKCFDAARAVRSALLRTVGAKTVIESLSDSEFESLSQTLPGVILNREEVLLAEPEPKFFLSLARRHGGPADVQFFKNYAATVPGGVWRSYTIQQTDVTGCTDFANGELVKRYAGWLAFRSAHPKAYFSAVRDQLAAIERAVSEDTCACGSRGGVLRELELFARTFRNSPVRPKVQGRIRAIRRSRSSVNFNCQSG
jgi:hypothetical protein